MKCVSRLLLAMLVISVQRIHGSAGNAGGADPRAQQAAGLRASGVQCYSNPTDFEAAFGGQVVWQEANLAQCSQSRQGSGIVLHVPESALHVVSSAVRGNARVSAQSAAGAGAAARGLKEAAQNAVHVQALDPQRALVRATPQAAGVGAAAAAAQPDGQLYDEKDSWEVVDDEAPEMLLAKAREMLVFDVDKEMLDMKQCFDLFTNEMNQSAHLPEMLAVQKIAVVFQNCMEAMRKLHVRRTIELTHKSKLSLRMSKAMFHKMLKMQDKQRECLKPFGRARGVEDFKDMLDGVEKALDQTDSQRSAQLDEQRLAKFKQELDAAPNTKTMFASANQFFKDTIAAQKQAVVTGFELAKGPIKLQSALLIKILELQADQDTILEIFDRQQQAGAKAKVNQPKSRHRRKSF